MPHLLLDLNLIIVLILVAHDELCFLPRLGFVHISLRIRLRDRDLEKAQLNFLKVLEGCLKEVYDIFS